MMTTQGRIGIVMMAFGCVFLLILAWAIESLAQPFDLAFQPPDREMTGVTGDDRTGETLFLADIDGDGDNDIVVGAPGVDYAGRTNCGAVYVLLSTDTMGVSIDLAVPRPDTRVIIGPSASTQIGDVLACGDVNNDGKADVICGVPGASPNGKFAAGEIFVIFGSDMLPDTLDLAAPATSMSRIQGVDVFDRLGASIASADVDGDGFDDVIGGAPFASSPAGSFSGKVYAIYGASSLPALIDLASPSVPVTHILGERANDTFGTACFAGDVIGDSIADILVGAPEAPPLGRSSAGMAYLVRGRSERPDTIDMAQSVSDGTVRILGAAAGALTGSAFAVADVDGDDDRDVVVGAPEFSPPGRSKAGAVFVVLSTAAWPDTIDLADGADGTRIDGPTPNLKAGGVIEAGDFNLDGKGDVVVAVPLGTPAVGREEAGKVFIVFGRPLFSSVIDLAASTETAIRPIFGRSRDDRLGGALAAGKTQPAGFDDLLLGASGSGVGGQLKVGRAFMVFGGDDITPTQVRYFLARAFEDGVHLVWQLADDLPRQLIVVERLDLERGTTRVLPTATLEHAVAGRYSFIDVEALPNHHYRYTVSVVGDDPQVLFVVDVSTASLPAVRLHPGFPNPFRNQARFTVERAAAGRTAVRVYDVSGALVATLFDGDMPAGTRDVRWDARNRAGGRVPSGIYFVRLEAAGVTQQHKIVVIR